MGRGRAQPAAPAVVPVRGGPGSRRPRDPRRGAAGCLRPLPQPGGGLVHDVRVLRRGRPREPDGRADAGIGAAPTPTRSGSHGRDIAAGRGPARRRPRSRPVAARHPSRTRSRRGPTRRARRGPGARANRHRRRAAGRSRGPAPEHPVPADRAGPGEATARDRAPRGASTDVRGTARGPAGERTSDAARAAGRRCWGRRERGDQPEAGSARAASRSSTSTCGGRCASRRASSSRGRRRSSRACGTSSRARAAR